MPRGQGILRRSNRSRSVREDASLHAQVEPEPEDQSLNHATEEESAPTQNPINRRTGGPNREMPIPESEERRIFLNFEKKRFIKEALWVLRSWGFLLPVFNSLQQVFLWLKKESTRKVISPVAMVFCFLIYQVWRNHLAKTHSRPHASPKIVAATILGNIFCGPRPAARYWGFTASSGDCNPSNWSPPPCGWLKANVDSSLLPNGAGGFAFVIRNDMGDLLLACGGRVRHWDSGAMEKEAVLLLGDHVMPLMNGRSGLILEGDCVNLLKHISEALVLLKHGSADQSIQCFSFLLGIPSLVIKYIHRDCNRLADCAAYLARLNEFCWTDLYGTCLLLCPSYP